MTHINYLKNILNKTEKIKLFFIAFLMILNAMFELLSVGILLPLITLLFEQDTSFLFENYFQFLSTIDHTKLIYIFLIGIAFIFVAKNLFIIFYNYQQGLFIKNLQIRVLSDLYKKYIFQKYSFFLQKDKDIGSILRNINIARIVSLCITSYLILALEIIIIILFISYLLYLSWLPTILISSIFLIFGWLLYASTKKKLYEWGESKQDFDAKISQQIIQTFNLVKNIKIFNKEKKMNYFFNKLLNKYESLGLKIDIVQQIPRGLVEVLCVFSICFLIFIFMATGKSTIEILTLTAIYAAVAFRLIPSSTRIITATQRIRNYAPSLILIKDEYLNNNISDLDKLENNISKINFEKIEFNNVNFSYENNKNILTDIDLVINRGEIIGFYGESGSGKSTLINLISGLIKPKNGKIKINGYDLENIKNTWLSILGYVPQQVTLFNDTIANNISFFEDNSDKKKLRDSIYKSLDQSNLKDFVLTLPNKEETIVGENAAKLSGGQIQRIGISRALFKDPQFLIFDESTNSLDDKTENEIMRFVFSLKKFKTVIIISHDQKILKDCDKIYELKNQKINKVFPKNDK